MRSLIVLLFACLAPSITPGGELGEVELYDRTDEATLPLYRYRGALFIAGEPDHQYEIRVHNSSSHRVLAVASVDGVNVVSGETASPQQSGYVLGAFESMQIEGWRKSLDHVATFYFTSLGDSYAARTGRANNVGVIGVALFRERVRCCNHIEESRDSVAASAAPPATRQKSAAGSARAERRLGTGHGPQESSAAQYVEFERASSSPDETIVIYYDSMRNLVARGIVPRHRPNYGKHGPRPFPHGFVPDP